MKFLLKYKENLLFLLLLIGILINIFTTVFQVKDIYLSQNYWNRYPALKKDYLDSVYANKKGIWLPDEVLYSYAGGAFVKGVSPILINPEVPPLGRYIIGLSILIFNNENIINLLIVLACLFLMYQISMQIFSSRLLSIIAPFLLSFETFYKNQLVHTPLLDIIQLFFLLTYFYIFNKLYFNEKTSKLKLIILQVILGCFISTKFFASGLPIVLASIIVLLFRFDLTKLFSYIITLPISVFVLLISYVRVLFTGYPLVDFLGIQKWVFLYNAGHVRNQFAILPLIFFNKWYVEWGQNNLSSDPQWILTWPVITILAFVTAILYIFRKIKVQKNIEILLAWSIVYFLFINLGNPSSRYLVIFFPVLYIISIYGVYNIYCKIRKVY